MFTASRRFSRSSPCVRSAAVFVIVLIVLVVGNATCPKHDRRMQFLTRRPKFEVTTTNYNHELRRRVTTTNYELRRRSYGASAQAARKSRMKESYKVEIGHQLWPRVMRGNRQLFRRSVHRGTARLSIELRKHYRLRWPTQSYLGEGYSHVGR